MPFTQADMQGIRDTIAPAMGREAWDAHRGYGARLTVNFGAEHVRTHKRGSYTVGKWHLWTDTCVWRIEDETGVLVTSEDPEPLQRPAVERLNGRRLLAMDISPTSADTTFTFDGGLLLRLLSFYMDPHGDNEHWLFFLPDGDVLVIGPGTSWSLDKGEARYSVRTDAATSRFEELCKDAWPCQINSFEIRRVSTSEADRLDLHLYLRPRNPEDERCLALFFRGLQHLNIAQDDAQTGVDYLLIEAVDDRQWADIGYAVHNPGQDILTFYCASFDVSVEQG